MSAPDPTYSLPANWRRRYVVVFAVEVLVVVLLVILGEVYS